MNKKIFDKEVQFLKEITAAFPRSPLQINNRLESDAEIIELKSNFDYLIFKVDGISEEIQSNLYDNPFLIGWMAVTATISDIAALGSLPLGILVALQLPENCNKEWLNSLQNGINEACKKYNIYVLGGDTNTANSVSIITTGIATISQSKPLFRKGMIPGDLLYSTSKLGLGNAYAFTRFFDSSHSIDYKPVARINEGKLIAKYATSCIDTSDGLFPALSVLSELNNIGVQFISPLNEILHQYVLPLLQSASIPAWMMLAGPHGEYELLFTIPAKQKQEFENACKAENWIPIHLGEIISGNNIHFISESQIIECQPAEIANLFQEANGNIKLYFDLLKKQHFKWTNKS